MVAYPKGFPYAKYYKILVVVSVSLSVTGVGVALGAGGLVDSCVPFVVLPLPQPPEGTRCTSEGALQQIQSKIDGSCRNTAVKVAACTTSSNQKLVGRFGWKLTGSKGCTWQLMDRLEVVNGVTMRVPDYVQVPATDCFNS